MDRGIVIKSSGKGSVLNSLFNKRIGKARLISLIFGVLAVILAFSITRAVVAYPYGLGGYFSQKTISRDGVTGNNPVIQREGNTGGLTVAMGPAGVTTLAATNVKYSAPTSADLNGSLTNLNGFPSADVWFEWGYNTGYGNIVGVSSMLAPGSYTAVLSGFTPGTIVHYRFVAGTDGINYGEDQVLSNSAELTNLQQLTNVVAYIFLGVAILMVFGLTVAGVPMIYSLILGTILAVIGALGSGVIVRVIGSW